MKKQKYVDIISSIILIALGAVYFHAASVLPEPLTSEPLGPAGFPQFLAIILIGLSLGLLIRAIMSKSEEDNSPTKFTPKDIKCFLLIIVMLILYVMGIQYIGYLVSTFLFAAGAGLSLAFFIAAACFCVMGASWKKPAAVLIPSIIIGVVCYVMFKMLFNADLPSGILI